MIVTNAVGKNWGSPRLDLVAEQYWTQEPDSGTGFRSTWIRSEEKMESSPDKPGTEYDAQGMESYAGQFRVTCPV